ncbi:MULTISPECIES: hypothetical protein [Bacillaceae]|uniref:Uncharacterized protein n=2 Tax=Peribacillus TaxID=2675229 RepID=A0A1B3XS05_9BACI|nr:MULTISPECIES: hypothetical protein [Bacillaceae]AOH55981.1 hypothetical protein ABE28_016585 [Peribacillus muralis]KWW15939.1 hypothetical protein AS888_07815 [Peribacillus simplex]PJN89415.1 hypothetical protein CVN76_15465 [Bacillus sp. mrc49]
MNKDRLFKFIQTSTRGNFFSVEIAEDGTKVAQLAKELENEGRIKLRECTRKEQGIYLEGILKFVPS